MADLTKLSDEELAATILLLGEQAQEISNATALVRAEQQARVKRAEVPVVLGTLGASTLAECVSAAPARAHEIAAEAARVAAEEEAARVAEEAAQAEADNG